MSALFIIFTLVTAGAVQSLLPEWRLPLLSLLKPPLLLSLIIYFSLHINRSRALCAAVLAGFIYDTFCPSGKAFGISIPFFVLMSLNVFLVRKEVFSDRFLTYIIFGAMGAVLQTVYFAVIFSIIEPYRVWIGNLTLRLIDSLIAGALICPLVYLLITQIRRLVAKEEESRL